MRLISFMRRRLILDLARRQHALAGRLNSSGKDPMAPSAACDIYFVGVANAGKSSLINAVGQMLRQRGPSGRSGKRESDRDETKPVGVLPEHAELTSSPFPGTTLQLNRLPWAFGYVVSNGAGPSVTPDELLLPSKPKADQKRNQATASQSGAVFDSPGLWSGVSTLSNVLSQEDIRKCS